MVLFWVSILLFFIITIAPICVAGWLLLTGRSLSVFFRKRRIVGKKNNIGMAVVLAGAFIAVAVFLSSILAVVMWFRSVR